MGLWPGYPEGHSHSGGKEVMARVGVLARVGVMVEVGVITRVPRGLWPGYLGGHGQGGGQGQGEGPWLGVV